MVRRRIRQRFLELDQRRGRRRQGERGAREQARRAVDGLEPHPCEHNGARDAIFLAGKLLAGRIEPRDVLLVFNPGLVFVLVVLLIATGRATRPQRSTRALPRGMVLAIARAA